MFQVVLRHYRRFGLFSFGMACMSLSMVARSGAGLSQNAHLAFFGGSIAIFLAIALLLYRVQPSQRGLLELAGASALVSTLAQIYVPVPPDAAGLFAIAVFTGILTLAWAFLNSPIARSLGARTTWRDRHSCDIAYPAKLVWRHIVPGAAPADDHCTGFVERYETDDDEDDTMRIFFKERRAGRAEYQITFLERDAPHFCRFYFQGNEADGTLVDGIFTMSINVIDRRNCTLIAYEERTGLPLGHLIERWFDDVLGFQHDRLMAILHERYSGGRMFSRPIDHAVE